MPVQAQIPMKPSNTNTTAGNSPRSTSGSDSRNSSRSNLADFYVDQVLLGTSKPIAEPDTMEKNWAAASNGGKSGWWIGILALFLSLTAGFLVFAFKIKTDENRVTQQLGNQLLVQNADDDVNQLIISIDNTVRSYLSATSVEEKLRYVRHAPGIRQRMEKYYESHPLEPMTCDIVTKYQPFTLSDRPFWGVRAVIRKDLAFTILLEQVAATTVLVDWESHVCYQPMAWEQYIKDKPTKPIAFRLNIKKTSYYFGEFVDERRWASYQLSMPYDSEILYGYVLRDSEAHKEIQRTLENKSSRIILRLQASAMLTATKSVVIESFVSGNHIRMDPPTSLFD